MILVGREYTEFHMSFTIYWNLLLISNIIAFMNHLFLLGLSIYAEFEISAVMYQR